MLGRKQNILNLFPKTGGRQSLDVDQSTPTERRVVGQVTLLQSFLKAVSSKLNKKIQTLNETIYFGVCRIYHKKTTPSSEHIFEDRLICEMIQWTPLKLFNYTDFKLEVKGL